MANAEAAHGNVPLTLEELEGLSDDLGLEIGKASGKARPSSIMLYGPPKVGKTQLAGSICEVAGYERVLMLDFEVGSSTLSHTYPNIDVIDLMPDMVRGEPDYGSVIRKYQRVVNAFTNSELLLEKYDAVIFDTLDVWQEALREHLINLTNEKKASYHVWGALNKETIKAMWVFHRLPVLTIFNVHQRLDTDDVSGRSVIFPALESGARNKAASIPDIIGYLSVDKDRNRILDVLPEQRMQTGNRFEHVLDESIGNPTMKKIYRRIDGK